MLRSAPSMRPLRIMSIATALPTARVRRCVPPAPGMTPRLISGWPNLADSEATIRSHAIASSHPPPRQKPETAATRGVRRLRIASHRSRRRLWYSDTGVPAASSAMSAPAANARSLPPRTMQRTASSSSSFCRAATSSSISSPDRAFSCCGRLSKTTAIGSARSTRTSASEMPSPPPAPRRRASTLRASPARGSRSRATRGHARS